MEQGICLLTIIPLRREPSEKSEMVSQMLFGEVYEIIEKTSAWYKIITEFDQYSGWMDKKMFSPVSGEYYERLGQGGYTVTRSVTAELLSSNQTTYTITAGSTIGYARSDGMTEMDSLLYRLIDQSPEFLTDHPVSLIDTAQRYLHSPYLWGGRTPFGYDCSGFTQMVFKINGTRLPRDAWQQAAIGMPVQQIQELTAGDLVFFANEENKVVHVGFAIPPDHIIHCSGMVRIDVLDDKGIFNKQLNQYTHRLYSMRRV